MNPSLEIKNNLSQPLVVGRVTPCAPNGAPTLRSSKFKTLEQFPPLSKGEGRGEGEQVNHSQLTRVLPENTFLRASLRPLRLCVKK
jgi:hypothetical protein